MNKWGSVNKVGGGGGGGGGSERKTKMSPSIKHSRVILYNSSLEIYVKQRIFLSLFIGVIRMCAPYKKYHFSYTYWGEEVKNL